MRAQITNRDYELLSAYLDGQLAPGEKSKLEERLRARPDLKSALDDLNRTRALLRSAPRRRAPRNFTLTPAMVGEQRPGRRTGWFNSLFPALSFASAIATLALVASMVFELAPLPRPSMTAGQPYNAPPAAVMEAPAQPPEDTRALQKESAPEEEAAPQAEAASQMEAAPEEPAAGEQPAAEAAEPLATQPAGEAPGIAALPAGEEPAPDTAAKAAEEGAPPVVAWDGQSPSAGDRESSIYASPPGPTGMGGGGPDVPMGDFGGMGSIILPLEAAESLETEQGEQSAAPAVKPDLSIPEGGGPILGLPEAEEGGEILYRSAWGEPLETGAPDSAAGSLQETRSVYGLRRPTLRVVQGLLAALAVGTGIAAYLIRRRHAG